MCWEEPPSSEPAPLTQPTRTESNRGPDRTVRQVIDRCRSAVIDTEQHIHSHEAEGYQSQSSQLCNELQNHLIDPETTSNQSDKSPDDRWQKTEADRSITDVIRYSINIRIRIRALLLITVINKSNLIGSNTKGSIWCELTAAWSIRDVIRCLIMNDLNNAAALTQLINNLIDQWIRFWWLIHFKCKQKQNKADQ